MIPSRALAFTGLLAFLAVSFLYAGETFPSVHPEPIAVHVLYGMDGKPLAHAHLTLIGGYGQRDLQVQLWHEEALTDAQGYARLSNLMANLPYLQVWVAKRKLCLSAPRSAAFSVERIRRDGLSSPNRCGIAMVEDAPGVFTVFIKGKKKKELAKADAVQAAPIPTPAAATAPAPASASPAPPSAATLSQKTSAVASPPAPIQAPASTPAKALGSPPAGSDGSGPPVAAPAPIAAPPAKPGPVFAPVQAFTPPATPPAPAPRPADSPAGHPAAAPAHPAPARSATGKPRPGMPASSRPAPSAVKTAAHIYRRGKLVAAAARPAKPAPPPDASANVSNETTAPAKPAALPASLAMPSAASCPPTKQP